MKRIGETSAPSRHYEKKRKLNPKLWANKKIRSSQRWRDLRALFIRKNPLCFDPFGNHELMGVAQVTEQVHHIVGLYKDRDLAFDEDNLAALCTWCHAKIEKSERKGTPTQHFFNK